METTIIRSQLLITYAVVVLAKSMTISITYKLKCGSNHSCRIAKTKTMIISTATTHYPISRFFYLFCLFCIFTSCLIKSIDAVEEDEIRPISSEDDEATDSNYFDNLSDIQKINDHGRELKICSVSGGLDIARFISSNLRDIFRGAIEDVEFIREYVSEAAFNQGITGGFHELDAMNESLDWQSRNMTPADTTISAGLGYADDRRERRVERWITLVNEPFVGTKATDMALIDSVSNIFPWVVDRKSDWVEWWSAHQNGRSDVRSSNQLDRLYTAAWIGTRGEAWMYYPTLPAVLHSEQAISYADITGPTLSTQDLEFVKPNLPENNPERKVYFTPPYSDTAQPGLSMITAQAPVYFTGNFRGTVYDDTYIASTGIDISVATISPLLDELEGTLTKGSFAFVVEREQFGVILISQSTVEKIYPERTGFEESRIVRSPKDGSILDDRRNQTYLVSDTIFQSPLDLDNADWKNLAARINHLEPGQRAWTEMDITLTGDDSATNFYAMYEAWPDVADWALVIFAPKDEVNGAVNVSAETSSITLEVRKGAPVKRSSVIKNNGILDVVLSVKSLPPWIQLKTELGKRYILAAGQNLTLEYETVNSRKLPRRETSLIALSVSDDGYAECFHEDVLTITVNLKVLHGEEIYLGYLRIYGYILTSVVVLSAFGWSIWVCQNKVHRAVRASQPVFLYMMCGGIVLMGVSIVPLGIDDGVASQRGCDIACMSVPWFLAMGFSITFSALFSKIWRINQIVQAYKNYQRVNISARHVMVPFLVIFSLNTTILGLWTGLDPITWKRKYTSGYNGLESRSNLSSVGFCSVSRSAVSLTCMILLLVVNFSALLLALVQLYKARKLAAEYSEGKYIAIAIGSMIQVFLTGLPILMIAQTNPSASYFVQSTIIFVVSMSLLMLTFLPKFYITSAEQLKGKTDNNTKPIHEMEYKDAAASSMSLSDVPITTYSDSHPREQHSTKHKGFYANDMEEGSSSRPVTDFEGELIPYISDMTEFSLFTISENEVVVDDDISGNNTSQHYGTSLDMLEMGSTSKERENSFLLHGAGPTRPDSSPKPSLRSFSSAGVIEEEKEEISPTSRERSAFLPCITTTVDNCPTLPRRRAPVADESITEESTFDIESSVFC